MNLRIEATSQPWFTCLFLQLRLPCCTIATKKTFSTTPRIRLDPNQRNCYRLKTQLSIYSEIESNVATHSFEIWRCGSFVCSSCCIANWLHIADSSSYDQQPAEIDARCRDLLMSDSDPLAATTVLKDYQHYSKMGRWTQYDEVRIELYISELGLTLRAGRMTIVSQRV